MNIAFFDLTNKTEIVKINKKFFSDHDLSVIQNGAWAVIRNFVYGFSSQLNFGPSALKNTARNSTFVPTLLTVIGSILLLLSMSSAESFLPVFLSYLYNIKSKNC